jgi:hypothetical protein
MSNYKHGRRNLQMSVLEHAATQEEESRVYCREEPAADALQFGKHENYYTTLGYYTVSLNDARIQQSTQTKSSVASRIMSMYDF